MILTRLAQLHMLQHIRIMNYIHINDRLTQSVQQWVSLPRMDVNWGVGGWGGDVAYLELRSASASTKQPKPFT
jgi:hypothetical protein